MATQKEVDSLVKIAQAAFNNCYGLRSLNDLAMNGNTIAVCCQELEKILKAEGYVGVGLIVELFPRHK